MSREIKFRVWDEASMIMRSQSEYNAVVVDCFFNSGLILMQYTGLKDKNGVEIYEGDMVVVTESGTNGFSSRHKVVNWTHENYPAFDLHPPVYDELNSFYAISSFGDHTVEVIGNIYETPELLEAK